MNKFKKGDRVIVVSVDAGVDADVGQIGTVLEDSCAPWVQFDTPTRYPYAPLIDGQMARMWHCDCIHEDMLEPAPAPILVESRL